MSDEDLELLITLDEPEEEDIHQHEFENTNIRDGRYPVSFGEGDWTCALSALTVTTNDPMRGLIEGQTQPFEQELEIGICVVTCSRLGRIVEQKVFYDLAGMQRQIGVS